MQRKYKLGYDKFLISLYAVLLCTGLCPRIEGAEKQDSMSLIADFVKNFIKPYIEAHSGKVESPSMETFQTDGSGQNDVPYLPTSSKTHSKQTVYPKAIISSSIKAAIKDVVTVLQPYLQDDEREFNKFFDNDETTIIEILPKPELQGKPLIQTSVPNISKYEKMKSDIIKALEKENVSDKTKKLVTKTLDKLIAQVLGNKCSWRSVNISPVFRTGKPSITPEEWNDLKTQYLDFLNKKQEKSLEALQLFNDFHDFFSNVIKEIQSKSGRTRFKCQVIDDNLSAVQRSATACTDFKVCFTELTNFLQHIYDTFNETTVGVFTNYAAMYLRDVSSAEDGKTASVPKALEKAAKIAEQRVAKVYLGVLPFLKLDQNKTQGNNIRILRKHVKFTVKHILKNVHKHIQTDLASIEETILETIKKDLDSNLNVELGNQETELKQKICALFMTCNGRVSDGRRSFSSNREVKEFKPGSIYVKLLINADDETKDVVSKPPKETKSPRKKSYHVTRTTPYANYSSNLSFNLVK